MSRWTPYLAAALGVALGAAGMLWVEADVSVASPDRVRTEHVVRDYILSHPELIQEAAERLQQGDASRAVAANRARIETPVGSAWTGAPHGDVTLVEYYDYNCGYCRASLPVLDQLTAGDPGVRIVYQELPVLAPSSQVAARLSLAAAEQGRWKPFHDALFAAGPVSPQTIAAAAKAAGVDTVRAAASADRYDGILRANLALVQPLGMAGTPSWVIGGRVLVGAQTLDQLKDAVADARDARRG